MAVVPNHSANADPLGVKRNQVSRRSSGDKNLLAKPRFSIVSAMLVIAAVVTLMLAANVLKFIFSSLAIWRLMIAWRMPKGILRVRRT